MTFLSLFAGIGGLDLGLERAGMRCIGQVEIDPYCRAVLAKHWPDVPRFDDVRTFNAGMLSEQPDLICGGFPCQDISNCGPRTGIVGTRSGLWSEFRRLICEIRPSFVFVENVSALLGRGLGTVLGDLATGGYDAEWECIPAAALGAPHRRDRIWIVAYPQHPDANGERPHRAKADATRSKRKVQSGDEQGSDPGSLCTVVADANEPRLEGHGKRCVYGGRASELLARSRRGAVEGCWGIEPNVGRVAHGIPSRVDRLKGLGNAVVPQVAEYIGRLILAADGRAVA